MGKLHSFVIEYEPLRFFTDPPAQCSTNIDYVTVQMWIVESNKIHNRNFLSLSTVRKKLLLKHLHCVFLYLNSLYSTLKVMNSNRNWRENTKCLRLWNCFEMRSEIKSRAYIHLFHLVRLCRRNRDCTKSTECSIQLQYCFMLTMDLDHRVFLHAQTHTIVGSTESL